MQIATESNKNKFYNKFAWCLRKRNIKIKIQGTRKKNAEKQIVGNKDVASCGRHTNTGPILTPESFLISWKQLLSACHQIPRLYWTWRFITMFTTPWHSSLSWARWMQSTPSHSASLKIHFNIILPSFSRSSECSFLRLPNQNVVSIYRFPIRATSTFRIILLICY
jgi:hypothetical protein